jgi:prevent-host-death family protein
MAQRETVDVVTLRTKLGQLLDRVHYQGARLTITKNGTAVAALVPLTDLNTVSRVDAVSKGRLPITPRDRKVEVLANEIRRHARESEKAR